MRKILISLVFVLFACGDNYHDEQNVSVDASITDAIADAASVVVNPCYNESDTMPEPTTQPVWNTDATNRTTPSGGLQASGYTTNAIPTSGNLNWYKNLVYQWVGWFRTVITANGAVVAVSGQNITVAGAGMFVSATGNETHGDRIIQVPNTFGIVDNTLTQTATWRFFPGVAGTLSGFWIPGSTFANANILTFPVPLKVGDRIKSVRGIVRDTTSHTISMKLFGRVQVLGTTSTTSSVQVGSTQTTAANGQYQALTLSSLTTTLVASSAYYITFEASSTTTTTHAICGVEITYDHP